VDELELLEQLARDVSATSSKHTHTAHPGLRGRVPIKTNVNARNANTSSHREFIQSEEGNKRREGVTSAIGGGPIVIDTDWLAKAASATGVDGKLHCNCGGNAAQENDTGCGELI
jgi:hypothetical protein